MNMARLKQGPAQENLGLEGVMVTYLFFYLRFINHTYCMLGLIIKQSNIKKYKMIGYCINLVTILAL